MPNLPEVDELERVMDRYGIKASELAKKTGIGKSAISRIVNHKYNPSYETMRLLYSALDQLITSNSRRVSDLMARKVVIADINELLPHVIGKMKKNGFSQIPVLSGGKFAGMVTERSLMVRSDNAQKAADVLGSGYAVMEPDDPLEKARQALLNCQAVVVISNGSLVGILTKTDLIE